MFFPGNFPRDFFCVNKNHYKFAVNNLLFVKLLNWCKKTNPDKLPGFEIKEFYEEGFAFTNLH